MKKLFFLLFPVIAFAQQPVKQLSFLPEHQFKYGENSISPDGKRLVVTFGNGDISDYELIDVLSLKLIAKGSFPARATSFSWTDDANFVAVDFIGKPTQCFDVKNGMKLLFTCKEGGSSAFQSVMALGAKPSPKLYLFNEEYVYQYSINGSVIDSTEQDDFDFFGKAWYNQYSKNFCVASDLGSELFVYNTKGEKIKAISLEKVPLISREVVDKNGSLYLYGDGKQLKVYDSYGEKLLVSFAGKEYYAATITPDSKSILLKTQAGFEKIDIHTKHSASVNMQGYFNQVFFAGYGTELLCLESKGIQVFNCKEYLPQFTSLVEKEKPAPPVVSTTLNKTEPPVTKTPPVPTAAKWLLPYKVTDFIVPLQKDSFYLWTPDRTLKKAIVYSKINETILWTNGFSYYDYFGFSNEPKFAQANTYILDNTDSTSRIASYAKSGIIEKPMMYGGQNFLIILPSAGKKSVSWSNEMYGDKANWTASIIDNVYKGVKGKCLVVTRKEISNGQPVDESYYYQKGIGLIKIESAGKVYMER